MREKGECPLKDRYARSRPSWRTVAALTALTAACSADVPEVRTGLSLREAMGGAEDAMGYARAVGPRAFVFPDDHGPHPGYRVEWWYVTGNLRATAGRRFGFQITFFRSAQSPPDGERRASAWAAHDVWMAHFAIVDPAAGAFTHFERFARGAAGLAGARASPLRVWLEDWSLTSLDTTAGAPTFPVRLRAAEAGVALDLILNTGRPPVLQGEAGLSSKGPEPGNASYYYSLMRMPAEGTLVQGGDSLAVDGTAWLDREWSTSALGEDLVGWDWFAIQLEDGHDIMLYQLRRADGSADPYSAGTIVDPAGAVRKLGADEFVLEPTGTWENPAGDTRYPVRWRVRVPDMALDLAVAAVLDDQEMDATVRYWEGAVDVRGSIGGREAAGVGYLEMTGYARTPAGARDRPPRRGR